MIAGQIFIGVCGIMAVYLSQSRTDRQRRWACIFGLAAQPAWFWETWHAGLWGIFALSFVYTANWARGFWNYWMRAS